MTSKFKIMSMLSVLIIFSSQKSNAQANINLSNLSGVAINATLTPGTDNSINLGSATKQWKQLWLSNAVFMGGSKFISFGNTLSLGLTAVGNNALAANTGGFANTGIGYFSLAANTNGNSNAAIGTRSLQANTTGSSNMAMGYFSLYSNSTGYSNVAIGVRAMLSSTGGHNQIAIGDSALFHLNGGTGYNTAIGSKALYSNTVGGYNLANGFEALNSNTIGSFNSAVGNFALHSNTEGSFNTAGGYAALNLNTAGNYLTGFGAFSLYNNSVGMSNTAMGYGSLYTNTTGLNNSALGTNSLYLNIEGTDNTAAGAYALANNLASDNTGVGSNALSVNATGTDNTANGYKALFNNNSDANTAVGSLSLLQNTSGNLNTAIGFESLIHNSSGFSNVGVGGFVLGMLTTGSSNTAVGEEANISQGDQTNSTAIGAGAIALVSNQVWLGNSSVTSVRAAASFTILSDGRFKKDIQANVPGLEFIKELRPVTYHYNIHGVNDYTGASKKIETGPASGNGKGISPATADPSKEMAITAKEKILYTGFVAQEVETAAKKFNYDFSGLYKPQNEKDLYGLSYSDFVVPLVKAVQELNDSLNEKNRALVETVDSLKIKLQRLEEKMDGMIRGSSSGSISLSDASLGQNMPNPFVGSTSIDFSIPQNFRRAQLLVTDMSGRVIKSVSVNSPGRGNLNIDASGLSSGIYNYTLYVDDKLISTRQMVLTK